MSDVSEVSDVSDVSDVSTAPSLMDDIEFRAELERLEPAAPHRRLPPSHSEHSGWDDLDDGLVTDVVSDDSDSAEWTPNRATSGERSVFEEETPTGAVPPGLSAGRTMLLAAGALVMMGVGAGVAALIFRDRLALVLR